MVGYKRVVSEDFLVCEMQLRIRDFKNVRSTVLKF